MPKILGIITARGGSKRLPGKNVKMLAGEPLIAHTIDAAKTSGIFDRLVVSTDDEKISSASEDHGAEVLERPEKLATDESPTIDAIIHALVILAEDGYEPDIVVLLQPTSPLRTGDDIRGAFEIFELKRPDSLVSMTESQTSGKWNYSVDAGFLGPAVEGETIYRPNGAIYISTPENLKKTKDFYKGSVLAYIMPTERSVDIDIEEDFAMAEGILLKK